MNKTLEESLYKLSHQFETDVTPIILEYYKQREIVMSTPSLKLFDYEAIALMKVKKKLIIDTLQKYTDNASYTNNEEK